jgi:thiaminase
LHDQDAFLDGVAWLERELDAQWSQQNETAIDQAFQRAISLEIAFHADPLRAD